MTEGEKSRLEKEANDQNSSVHTQEDREKGSAAIFRTITNTIFPRSIRMVEDVPWNHLSLHLPILDTEMRVENGLFQHRHYSKPMASLVVVPMSKISILSQEGSRRLRNCSLNLPWNEKLRYINRLMISLMWDGYSETTREIMARRLLAKYQTNLDNFENEGRPLYRSKEMRAMDPKPDKVT